MNTTFHNYTVYYLAMTGPTTLWSAAVESSGFAMVNQPHSLHTEQFNHFLHTQFTRNSMSSEGCRDRKTDNRDRQDMKGRESEREKGTVCSHHWSHCMWQQSVTSVGAEPGRTQACCLSIARMILFFASAKNHLTGHWQGTAAQHRKKLCTGLLFSDC